MGRKALVYTAGLIALYIAANKATGLANVIKSAGSVASQNVKTLQGR